MKILILCTGNSCRSQMAQGFLQSFDKNITVCSAGTEPAKQVNPKAIQVMKEVGIDISGKATRSVFDVYKSGELFSYVITVCDESAAEGCPIFPGPAKRLHWSLTDPSTLRGTEQEKIAKVREIRDLDSTIKCNTRH